MIALTIICLYGTGCTSLTGNPTDAPPPDAPPKFTIDTPDKKTTMAIGQRTSFNLKMEPENRAKVNSVTWTGNYGIVCEEDTDDLFIGYCTAKDDTQVGDAAVFADIEGVFFGSPQRTQFAVEIMPGESPDTPTPTPTIMPVDTPTPTPLPSTTDPPPPPPAANAIFIDNPPAIDGRLNDDVWSKAKPLTIGVHSTDDATTTVVRLLWDDENLYVGFDIIDDAYVERGSELKPFDGDSVSAIIDNGGIKEYRHSLLSEQGADRRNDPISKHYLKEITTINDTKASDEGYSVEMQIPWEEEAQPIAGSTIRADFLSVDHDKNPEGEWDDDDTDFSKISWDGDENVDTAGRQLLLLADTLTPTDTPSPPPTEPPATDTPSPPPPTPAECPFDNIPFRASIGGPPLDVEVSIASILNCADNLPTASSIPLTGTYSGDLTNKELWILVYPPDLKYYPQTPDACTNVSAEFAGGQWSTIIRLGRAGVPEAFHIVAVVTDIGNLASEAFHKYLTDGCSQTWGSVNLIPPGATELDAIIVHTR
jgi:hypothetical protein